MLHEDSSIVAVALNGSMDADASDAALYFYAAKEVNIITGLSIFTVSFCVRALNF